MSMGGVGNYVAGGIMGTAGLVQFAIGMNEMKKLNRQQWAQYGLTGNSQMSLNESMDRAKHGYTPEEVAGYQGRIARGNNTAYSRGINYGGGNLATAVQQGINYNNVRSQLDFSLHDAELHRRNIMDRDRAISYEQSLANLNTAQAIDIRKGKIAGAQNLVNTGAANFTNSAAVMAGSGSGQAPNYVKPSATQAPDGQQEAPVDYNAGNSGYNQGYNKNEWLYGYANQGQNSNVEMDPYQIPQNNSSNYHW